MRKVNVLLADGFEEIEALTVVDLLRRAQIYVSTVSIMEDDNVHGAHGINVQADELFEDVDFEDADMIVLPGGMPGTLNLNQDPGVREVVKEAYRSGRYVAAICAAPTILASLGILNGRRATSYPTMQPKLEEAGAILVNSTVVVEDNIVTSQGMGTAIDFALTLVSILVGEAKANELAASIVYV